MATQYYVHLLVILVIALIWLCETCLAFNEKADTEYDLTDRLWAGGIALGAVNSMVAGPGIIHSLVMIAVLFLTVLFIANHDHDSPLRSNRPMLALCWYLSIFSFYSLVTY